MNANGEYPLEVDRLTRSFGALNAVDGLSFRMPAGEVVGLLGPNGAGKTTVLRVLAGFIPPTSGCVRVAGHDIVESSLEARRRIGYLPEQFSLYNDMLVYDYLKFRAYLRGLRGRDRRRRTTEMLALFDLESEADLRIDTLSRGCRQRIGLAESLIHDPPVLLLDEPSQGLDPGMRERLRLVLRERGARAAVLFSSHAVDAIERICDRVMVMVAGRIVAADTPEALIDRRSERARFVLEARGRIGELLQACRETPGVLNAVVESDREWSRLRIESVRGGDFENRIFQAAVRAGCVLRECRRERERLEDVFEALTGAAPAAEGEGGGD